MRDQKNRRLCRYCRRARADDELFSARGICSDCARAAMTDQWENAVDQVTDPEWRDRWRHGMARAVGAILPGVGEHD